MYLLVIQISLLINICLLLFFLIRSNKMYIALRPSVVFISFANMIYSIPYVFFYPYINEISPYSVYFILSISFITTTVLLVNIFLLKVRINHKRIVEKESKWVLRYITLLVLSVILILVIYFSNVEFSKTALYSFICNPQNYVVAREYSLKLISSKIVKYLYSIGYSCMLPLIFALLATFIGQKRSRVQKLFLSLALIVFSTLYYSILGARVGWLYICISFNAVCFFHLKWNKFIPLAVLSFLIALSIPNFISKYWTESFEEEYRLNDDQFICKVFPASDDPQFLKDSKSYIDHYRIRKERSRLEALRRKRLGLPDLGNYNAAGDNVAGDNVAGDNVLEKSKEDHDCHLSTNKTHTPMVGYFMNERSILGRIFIIPSLIAGFYVEEANNNNGSLSKVLNGKMISHNISKKYIKRIYSNSFKVISTSQAPTTFIARNFIYMGWISIIASLFGVLFLDLIYYLTLLTKPKMLPITIGMSIYYCVIFSQTGYGTTLVSHGYLAFFAFVIFTIRRDIAKFILNK